MRKVTVPFETIRDGYISGKTKIQLAKELGVSKNTIASYGRKYSLCKRTLFYNESYFDTIDTPDKAYWLGLIIADGNISIKGGSSYTMEITLVDGYLIEKLRDSLCPSAKVSKRISAYEEDYTRLSVNNKRICESLMKYGIVPDKTHNYKLYEGIISRIDPSLERHLIRGFFDGDGGFKTGSYLTRKKKINRLSAISFANSSINFLKEVGSRFHFLKNNFRIYKYSDYNYAMNISVTTDDLSNLYDYLYDGADTYMIRKRDTLIDFLKIKTDINKQLMKLWYQN